MPPPAPTRVSARPAPVPHRDHVPQFDVVDAVSPTSTPCAECRSAITTVYYEVGGRVICPRCRGKLDAALRGSGGGRLLRAAGLGLLAAVVCAVIWYAVIRMTNSEFGLLALLVGFAVGKAVNIGTRGRGGRRYQVLAAVLTYLAIVTSYVPFIVKGLEEGQLAALADSSATAADAASDDAVAEAAEPGEAAAAAGASDASSDSVVASSARGDSARVVVQRASLGMAFAALAALLFVAAAAPVMGGLGNIIGMIIIGLALLQAWRLNRPNDITVSGPYRIRSAPGGADAGAAGV